ncbi:MAG: T9SS type A sorting domain-containing protein [candidate division Zixibacteria bacterium]
MRDFSPRIFKRRAKASLIFIFTLLTVFSANVFAAEIFTHESEYPPGNDAVIEGVFWASEKVTLVVTHLDGTPLTGPGGDPWEVDASYDDANSAPEKESGSFVTYWNVDWDYAGDELLVTATGNESGAIATTVFLTPNVNLDQLQNGTTTSNAEWANGNINGSNSCYSEGRSVAYRYFIKELDADSEHFFTIQMEWTKGGIHALDYLTDYDATETTALDSVGGACGTISTSPPPGCSDPTESFAFPDFLNTANYSGSIPPDFFTTVNPGFVLDGPRNLKAYNITIDSISDYVFDGTSSDRTLEMIVYFTVDTTGSVGFFWGGHLAESSADAWGVNNGSSYVGGAPYHMRALSLDGGGGANQDRSIQNGVICLPPNVGISTDFTTVCDVGNNMYIVTDTASTANTWIWTVINGTIVGPDNQSSVSFTVNSGLQAGDYVSIMVESCDSTSGCPGEFCCATDSIAIPVEICNQPPVASCPDNESHSFLCTPSQICVGLFSATDPDNNIVSETVDFGVLSGGNVCFTPDTAGVYTITYTVTDAFGETDQCQTEVTISYTNQLPVCNIPGDASYLVCGDTTFNIPVSATDPDGNLTGCTKTSGPGTFDGSTWTFTTTAPGVYTATFECSDDCGEVCGGTVNITVGYNSPPVCNLPSSGIYLVCSDTTFSFPVSATDVDGNLVRCIQKSGSGSFDGTDWTFTTTGPGVYSATFECTDECGEVCTGSVNITVNYNHNPVCNMPAHGHYFVCGDTTFNVPISATDVDGNLVGCTMTSGPGTFDGSTWTFTSSGDGTYIATFECSDECGASCTGEAKVSVTNNKAPTPQCPNNQTIFVCDLLPLTINGFICQDPNDNLATCEVDVGTLVGDAVTFTPVEGPNVITLTATDECGEVGTCYTTVTIVLNSPPVASCPPAESHSFLCEPSEICISGFSASDPDNNIANKSINIGILTNGTVCFTPDTAGVYTITYTVTDECGKSDECQTQVTVSFENNPPVCDLPGNGTYFVCGDTTFNFTVSASDPDGNLSGCAMTSGHGSFDGSTWTFTTSASGVYTATFECSDDCGATCGGTVEITVNYNQAPVVECPDNQTFQFACESGEICIGPFSATDSDNNIVDESVDLGTLTDGTVCFTPTAAGVYTITYTVTDACGATSECQTEVTVDLDNQPPVCDLPTDATYFICGDSTFNFEVSATDPDDNLTGCTMTSGDGSFDGTTWSFTATAAGQYTATFECSDECGLTCGGTVTMTIEMNNPPTCNIPENGSYFVCDDTTFNFPVSATDPDGNLVGCEKISGDGTLTDGIWSFTTTGQGTYTASFECSDECGETCGGTASIVVTYNNDPVAAAPNPITLNVCTLSELVVGGFSCYDPNDNLVSCETDVGTYSNGEVTFVPQEGANIITLFAVDDCGMVDSAKTTITVNLNQTPVCNLPGNQTFSQCTPTEVCLPVSAIDPDDDLTICEIVSGPGVIDNGQWCYTPGGSETVEVTVRCTDFCGAYCEGTFTINFEINRGPVVTCPDDETKYLFGLGEICIEGFECSDLDDNLSICQILVNGENGTIIDGTVCFDPVWGDNFIELTATDACGQSATCVTVVTVEELYECPIVKIEKTHNTLQGHYADVEVTIENGNFDLAGFDLLMYYDASALSFVNAEAGELLQYCGWEHFSYRFGSRGNCGGSCPSGLLRIIGLAETNNGALHPDCFGAPTADPWQLAVLTFYVSNDRTFNCMYSPIKFFWDDCGDNALSNISGDSMIIGSKIYDFEGNLIWNELDDLNYPENDRIPFTGTPDWCGNDGKVPPIRCADFVYGGIDIVCSDSIDDRGDINMNGLPNEVADAVMLTNYFISGLSAFGNHVEASIAASDVNADGVSLTVADLVYLVRIITGDADPLLKPIVTSEFNIASHRRGDQVDIKYQSEVNAGAALLIFEASGNVGMPLLGDGAEDMDMAYNIEDNQLRVLIYNIGSQSIKSGENTLLSIPSDGSLTLIGAEIADFFGGTMTTSIKEIPDIFTLSQNYPNPFNPSTSISLSMATPGDWSIIVYNIAGQIIREYSGYSEAGIVSVIWDGTDKNGDKIASGIYLYRAVSGQFKATRKMVLMK